MSGVTTLKDLTIDPSALPKGGAGSPAPETIPAPTPRGGTHPTSIADFLTDGSLPALCAELTRLIGVNVELRDAQGWLIVIGTGQPGPGNWRVVNDGKGVPAGGEGAVPIRLGALTLGWIILNDGTPKLAHDPRDRLESALSLLARTTAELCQHEVELRHRIKEVAALTRMSSLLVRAAGPNRVLEVALDSALDVLELDAGSIMLLNEDADGVMADTEADLILNASRNLSKDWLASPLPLSKDRVFDRLALSGQLVIVEDIKNDPRILIPERAAAENLGAAIHVGMVFKNRPLGVIRLYSRRPRGFDEGERRLLASLAEQAAAASSNPASSSSKKKSSTSSANSNWPPTSSAGCSPGASPAFPSSTWRPAMFPALSWAATFTTSSISLATWA